MGNRHGKVVVSAHPLHEGLGAHGKHLALGDGLVGGGEVLLSCQHLQIAHQVWHLQGGEGVALAAFKFVADPQLPCGQEVDVVSLLAFSHHHISRLEGALGGMLTDIFRDMVKHIFQLHIMSFLQRTALLENYIIYCCPWVAV